MNPFMSNPYTSAMPKTPQQVQQELNEMQQRYTNQYNQMMSNYPQQAPNTYAWKYQESDNEINSLQVPANGNPFILVGNGIFYVKQFKNGQPYVTAYSFQPLNNVGEPAQQKEDKKINPMDEINLRMNMLEEKIDEYFGSHKVSKKSGSDEENGNAGDTAKQS